MPNWDEVFKKKEEVKEQPKKRRGKRPKMVEDEILEYMDRRRLDNDNPFD